MMSKDQWIADYERILDNLADGSTTREDAIISLGNLGFTNSEIQQILEDEML